MGHKCCEKRPADGGLWESAHAGQLEVGKSLPHVALGHAQLDPPLLEPLREGLQLAGVRVGVRHRHGGPVGVVGVVWVVCEGGVGAHHAPVGVVHWHGGMDVVGGGHTVRHRGGKHLHRKNTLTSWYIRGRGGRRSPCVEGIQLKMLAHRHSWWGNSWAKHVKVHPMALHLRR